MTRPDTTQTWDPSTPASPGAAPAPGHLLDERFHLLERLGAGGSGTVYRAQDTLLDQQVAIKVFQPERINERALTRARREVSSSRTDHPNLITVNELYESQNLVYLAMELVDGTSLKQRLKTAGPLGIDQCVSVGAQVASALAQLHAAELVHRDVKPGNILLVNDGVKLCDLGLARPIRMDDTLTDTTIVVGTPAYMAPEQLAVDKVSTATDVFALGVTLYVALTGEIPLTRNTPLATTTRRALSRSAPLRSLRRDCPRWLERLVHAMLDPNPRLRPTAAEVEIRLRSRTAPHPVPRPTRVVAGVTLVALTLVVLMLVFFRGSTAESYRVSGSSVDGIGQDGTPMWSVELESEIVQEERADLDGAGLTS